MDTLAPANEKVQPLDQKPEPYVKVQRRIFRDPTLSPQAKALFGLLLTYAREDPTTFPKQDLLAGDMDVTDRTIRTWLEELHGAGLVAWRQMHFQGPNEYVLNPEYRVPTRKQSSAQSGKSLPPNPEGDFRLLESTYQEALDEEKPRSVAAEQERMVSVPSGRLHNLLKATTKPPLWEGETQADWEAKRRRAAEARQRLEAGTS